MADLLEFLKHKDYHSPLLRNEPMNRHCSLKLGGPADLFASPDDIGQLKILIDSCQQLNIPWMILGGGANILVADRGVRGLVIHTGRMDGLESHEDGIIVDCGCDVSKASLFALERNMKGLEWIYRMPGSFGGAVWMNARCYGYEMADIIDWVDVLTPQGKIERQPFDPSQWEYKISPYQHSGEIILRARVKLQRGDRSSLKEEMDRIEKDRIEKGHFKKPSAGSTFKNNRDFGAPSGKIIDECGLRGLRLGGAAVAPWHGNILINENHASSRDFLSLIEEVQKQVKDKTGFTLEPEVLPMGDWG